MGRLAAGHPSRLGRGFYGGGPYGPRPYSVGSYLLRSKQVAEPVHEQIKDSADQTKAAYAPWLAPASYGRPKSSAPPFPAPIRRARYGGLGNGLIRFPAD